MQPLLNCIVHCDYSFGGSIIINIYEDRIEFVSPGGLVLGLELGSIFLGVSQSRNPCLASIFYRMRLIESYGTGISKIERAYKDCASKPKFETAKGVFRVTLPNRNSAPIIEPVFLNDPVRKDKSEEEKELIVEFARKYGQITRKEAETLIEAESTKTFKLLKELCQAGKLEQKKKGRLSMYVIK